MIERDAKKLTTQAEEFVGRTTNSSRRSEVLDALGRYNSQPTAAHYDALHDAVNQPSLGE